MSSLRATCSSATPGRSSRSSCCAHGRERPRADVLHGRRHGTAPARRPRPTPLELLPPALRPGHESGHRPRARAFRHVALGTPRRPGPAARRGARRPPRASSSTPSSSSRPSSTARGRAPRRHLRGRRGARGAPASALQARRSTRWPRAHGMLLLSDAAAGPDRPPVPMLLATSARAPRLVEAGLRTLATLVVETDERAGRSRRRVPARLRRGADLPAARVRHGGGAGGGRPARRRPPVARRGPAPLPRGARGRRAEGHVEDGHLRRRELLRRADLRGARARPRASSTAASPARLRPPAASAWPSSRARRSHAPTRPRRPRPRLENPGYVKFRKGGEPHATNPTSSMRCTSRPARRPRSGARAPRAVGGRTGRATRASPRWSTAATPIELRDLLELVPPPSRSRSTRSSRPRRSCAASRPAACRTASLSTEAHETLAIAFNMLGGRSNCGEGGEDPARFRTDAQLEDQADRVGALRGDPRVRGLRRGAPDQDRPGLEAGRGRPAPRPQGHGRDRPPAAHAARRRR